jgi:hypothetical protein
MLAKFMRRRGIKSIIQIWVHGGDSICGRRSAPSGAETSPGALSDAPGNIVDASRPVLGAKP